MKKTIERILLIDDDQDDRYFFATALEEVDPGVALTIAADGLEAFRKLENDLPDMILLDMVMPGMSGMTFLKKIKSIEGLKQIPVTVYTSDLSIFDERDVLKLGAEKVILKADDYSGTVDIIAALLNVSTLKRSA